MAAIYELRIKTAAGVELHRLAANPGGQDLAKTGFIELAYTNQVNSYGLCSFVLPGTHSILADLTERCQVEVWRADPANGIAFTRDWSGLFLDEYRWYQDGQHLYKATCYSDVFKLQDREILWRADVNSRSRFINSKAETILKTLVQYNCTSDASVANGRIVDGTMSGITIQADAASGNVIDWKCAWDNLLDTLQKVASIGGGDFDLVKTAAATWEFRWYTGQRGTDRTASVLFSTELGNMGDPQYSKVRSSKKTSVTVGGQGQGADRAVANRTGNGFSSTANYEEFFNGSSQAETTAGLQAIGDRRLFDVRDQETFSFTVLPTPACVYGLHYFLGDRVTAKYLGVTTTPKIVSISISIDKSGQETVNPGLSYVG
jgi:hypothetical protein